MRRSTKAELRMLREMMWHFGTITKCRFCHEPLLVLPKGARFGERDHSPVKARLAIHHEDEDHENNKPSNRKPAHSTCHKRHHAKKRHKGRGLEKENHDKPSRR